MNRPVGRALHCPSRLEVAAGFDVDGKYSPEVLRPAHGARGLSESTLTRGCRGTIQDPRRRPIPGRLLAAVHYSRLAIDGQAFTVLRPS